VSGKHDNDRLRVETWEIVMAKRIAGTFRARDEELAAVLLARIAELKIKTPSRVRKWQAYLAQALYNAAKNFIRHEDVLRARFKSFELTAPQGDRPVSLEEILRAPTDSIDLRLDLNQVRNSLSPEMRTLWELLVDHRGNISSVAKALGRPRKTVDYRVQQLRALFKKCGLE
jgi:DNA-directed RNA polymerase specialized sigma24 family protein